MSPLGAEKVFLANVQFQYRSFIGISGLGPWERRGGPQGHHSEFTTYQRRKTPLRVIDAHGEPRGRRVDSEFDE